MYQFWKNPQNNKEKSMYQFWQIKLSTLRNPCNSFDKSNNLSKNQNEDWLSDLQCKAMIGLGSDKLTVPLALFLFWPQVTFSKIWWNINWGTFVLEPGYREEERTSTGRFVGKVNLNWKYIFPTNLNCSQCISCPPGLDTIIWEVFFVTFYKDQSSSNIPVWFSVFLDSFQSRTNFQFAEIKETLEVESTERGTKSSYLSVFGFSNKERDCSVNSDQCSRMQCYYDQKKGLTTPPLSP